ncbi:MAG TPA: hypothetical protein VF169_21265 [Albitalea sp.]|uniref:hypothetical protein n=1 Tax=Piscinibacter sp. TaxID=1903157 RepID=UPI002ED0D3AC
MTTDPHKPRGSEHRPSGTESKDERRADPAGKRTRSGSTYGDWTPAHGQAHQLDDRDQDPIERDFEVGASDPMHIPPEPGGPRPRSDRGQSGSTQTGVLGEPEQTPEREPKPQADESAAVESNRNKSFDTTHVHSGTTVRKV